VAFHGPVKPGANTRRAGEDVVEGAAFLAAGRVLTPADLALSAALGWAHLPVRERLKVGVLSTGDEIVPAGAEAGPGQIYDANRPMLLAMLSAFGFTPVDLGHVKDDRATLRDRLNKAAREVSAILTSGGASAGDEDHVSALLKESGALQEWRIALKPGRPLALGMWSGVPVFGLPGNPVAAFVCTLIFARPALGLLAGAGWQAPQGFDVPAAFSKRKKPGRREYLRARMRDGRAEVFASEGSGRISGLSWAEGLVELGDEAREIAPGDPVRFIPYGSFGL
jgi:molybdopterin molybdotransferase